VVYHLSPRADTIAGLRVNADGSLTPIGTVPGHPDMEGIVAF
jgi:hypothetical protein